MSDAANGPILSYLRRIGGRPGDQGVTDRELLGRFVARRDEAAFELLLWRYGPMVRHVCLGVTRDHHEAEDAFQATFLVLARKARSVRRREALGSWLYRVAYRIALRARYQALRRAVHEKHGLDLRELPHEAPPAEAVAVDELRLLLEEVNRLPAKYRTPVILCYLEGKTHEEAARQLGWPKGTVSGRLARARAALRARLVRRGVALSAAALTAALGAGEAGALAPLLRRTLSAAVGFGAGGAGAAGSLSGPAVLLAEGMLRTMFLSKLRVVVAVVFASVLLGSGAGLFARFTVASGRPMARAEPADPGPARGSPPNAGAPGPDRANEQAAQPADGRGKNPEDKPPSPEETFRTLVEQFDAGSQNVSRRDGYEKRVLKLAEANPGERFVPEALMWVLQRGRQRNGGYLVATTAPFGQSAARALDLLAKDHARDPRVGEIVEHLLLAPPAADPFLRAVMEKNPDRSLQARASLSLAARFKWQAELAPPNEKAGQDYAEAEKYFALAVSKYGDVPYYETWTVGEYARGTLYEVRHLVVGKTAPEIEGEDLGGNKLKLSDYRGKVVLLDFYWWANDPRQTIHPFERSLEQKYQGRPFAILGINRDKDRAFLRKAMDEEGITWRSWFDDPGKAAPAGKLWFDYGIFPGPITVRWNVRLWPTLYLLDDKGVIRAKSLGARDMGGLVEKLVRAAEAASKPRKE
jgi:RNA polymerase sigma factor (sigma-70 family)